MYKMISRLRLIISITLLINSSVFCDEWLDDCHSPREFEVELENHEKFHIYNNINSVKFDRNTLGIYQYPSSDKVNILINDSFISFAARIWPNNDKDKSYETYRIFETKIAGTAKLVDNKLTNCDLYVSRNKNEPEFRIPKELQREIFHQSATCIKAKLCQQLSVVGFEDYKRAEDNPFDFGRLSALVTEKVVIEESPNTIVSTYNDEKQLNDEEIRALFASYQNPESNEVNRNGLQSTINKLVDLAVTELVKKIQEENQGKIKIPDLSQNFSTGSSWWETTGEFNAFDGTFEDLTTLSRTEDAKLSHSGMKFEASCGFGLKKANLEYPKYKLRYGIVKVNGKLSGSIDGVALNAQVAVDYNQKPCRAVLDNLNVTEVGKIKVNITGLGPLNKLLSKLVTWITKKWQDEIINKVENKLSELITKNLNKLNCEKYRP